MRHVEQPSLTDLKKVFSTIGFALAISFLVVNLIQIILTGVMVVINPSLLMEDWVSFILIVISFYLIGFPLFCFMVRQLPDGEVSEIKKLNIKELVQYGFMSYAIVYVFNLLTILLTYIIELMKSGHVISPVEELIVDSSPLLTLVCVVIISPIIEEILFRKIILNKLRDYGDKIAILFTAVAFGLYHGNVSQFFYATALGCLFAYLTLKTNRIQYAIYLHIFINAMGSLILPYLICSGAQQGGWIERLQIVSLLGIILVVLGIFLIIKKRKEVHYGEGTIDIPKEEKFKVVWLNPGMITYFLITFGLAILIISAS